MSEYIDKMTVSGTSHPLYAQGITDGTGDLQKVFSYSRLMGALLINVPSDGWQGSQAPYTLTISLTGEQGGRVTADIIKNAFCYYDSASVTWNEWKAQKKSFSKFSQDGTITVPSDDTLLLKTSRKPSVGFTIAIMGV